MARSIDFYIQDFPPYLKALFHLPQQAYTLIPLGVALVFILTWLYLKYQQFQKSRKVDYAYLEVKPTDRTLKTPLSTTQLFASLHSLIKSESSGLFFTVKKSISFELVSTKEEGIRFILRVPKEVDTIVYKNLLAYLPGIEVNFIDDYLTLKLFEDGIEKRLQRQELKFSNSYLYPLKAQDFLSQFDPIAFTTAHMTKLLDNEMVIVQFIATPITNSTHLPISDLVKKIQDRLANNLDISDLVRKTKHSLISRLLPRVIKIVSDFVIFSFQFVGEFIYTYFIDTKAKTKSYDLINKSKLKYIQELGVHKQKQFQDISTKISEPLFETTVRMMAVSSHQESAQQRLKGLFSSFETFNSQDQKVKKYKSFLWNSDKNFLQNLFKFELRNRLAFNSPCLILSTSELSSLYHLPYTQTTKTEDLLQVKSPQLPAPLSFKQSSTKLDIIFANNRYGDTVTPIGQTLEQRRRHTHISGQTGTGKSTLMLQMIYQDLKNGKGMCIVDPHGDMADKVLEIIPQNRIKDVIFWDPSDLEYPIGLNILKLPKNLSKLELEKEKTRIVSGLIAIFHKLYPERYSGPRMEHLLRNLVLTALTVENPNLETLYNLLTDYKFRKPIVDKLQDPIIKRFWQKEFSKLGSYMQADMIGPITNKLSAFLTTAFTREIVLKKDSLDIDDILNNKKILICKFSKGLIGEDNLFFLGGLLIVELQRAALRRIKIEEEKRVDFYLYIDEFQNFATKSFEEIISEARKYRLNLIIAHQNTTQIDNQTFDIISANCGTTICFRTNSPIDEDKLLPLFAPKVEVGQLQNLPSYTFYIKISAISPQDPFTGEVEKFTIKDNNNTREAVITNTQQTYGSIPEKGDKQEDASELKTSQKSKRLFQRRANIAVAGNSNTNLD